MGTTVALLLGVIIAIGAGAFAHLSHRINELESRHDHD